MDTIYSQRAGGRQEFWYDNRDTGGRVFISAETAKRHERRKLARIVYI